MTHQGPRRQGAEPHQEQPQQRRPRSYDPTATGWRRMLLWSVTAGLLATVSAAGLGWLLQGVNAAASASIGGGLQVVLTGMTLLSVVICERRAPHWTMAVLVTGFAAKAILLGIVASVPTAPGWSEPMWLILTAAAVMVVVQAVELACFSRLRLGVGRLS